MYMNAHTHTCTRINAYKHTAHIPGIFAYSDGPCTVYIWPSAQTAVVTVDPCSGRGFGTVHEMKYCKLKKYLYMQMYVYV